MRRTKKLSIKSKIILLALCSTLIPLLIIGPLTFLYINKVVENKVTRTTSNFLSVLDGNINNFVVDVENISNTIFSSNDIQRYLQEKKSSPRLYILETSSIKILNNISIVNNPYISAIYIGNEHHELLKINQGENNYSNQIFNRIQMTKWYGELKSSEWGGVWIKGGGLSFVKGTNNSLMFGRIVRDIGTSKEIGLSIISVDQSVFSQILKGINKDGEILIVDKQNTIYFSGDKEKFKSQTIAELIKPHGKQGTIINTINGAKYVINFHTNANTGWKIISIIPYQLIVKEINDLRIFTASILVLSFLLATICALLIAHKITKQLDILRRVTKNLEKRENISDHGFDENDEIGNIGKRFVELYNRNNKLTVQLYESQLKEKEAELLALQNHINPHFLYNTLNCIYWMAEKAKVSPISKMAISLSKLFKLTLNNGEYITTVRNEIEQVNHYLQIQNLRFDHKIEVVIDIEPSIMDELMIKLLLQPIVENAVQHGLEQKQGKGRIEINGIKRDKILIFEIIDNGVGFNNEGALKNNSGYALKNINERIKLHYGSDFGLSIESKVDKGTKVILTIGRQTIKCA
ncbi:sensor histidine kinase [Bacillus sp. 03113]|uniref:cache domain-containing sensor histidine kinase n=1 Tax=Bacillus sp. 03113 TaxID=2578211 RepID=UPI0015E8882D|nr:sensor histidine kinase [Bacillus sp. 03113]